MQQRQQNYRVKVTYLLTLGACARGLLYLVCVCVCVSVCPLSTSCFKRLYNKMNISAGYTLIPQGFQLTDFSTTFSFKSYSVFTHF